MTQMALQPRGKFGSPTSKSIAMCSHFHSCIDRGCSSLVDFLCFALTCWYCRHCDTNSTISFFIPSHHNVSFKSWYMLEWWLVLIQGVGYNICFARMILNENIIIFNQLQPSSLSHVQVLLDKRILQTLVNGDDHTCNLI